MTLDEKISELKVLIQQKMLWRNGQRIAENALSVIYELENQLLYEKYHHGACKLGLNAAAKKFEELQAENEKLKKDYDQLLDNTVCNELYNAKSKENEKLKERLRWQPISTAPKDGTKIILLHFEQLSWPKPEIKFWARIRIGYFTQYGWQGQIQGETSPHIKEPEYWMPLPKPPINNNQNNNE